MPKYIDADAVIDIVMQYCPDDDGSCSKADVDIREMFDEIECLPTVDAVPVVRCKDCESWGLNAIKKDEKGEVIYGDCLHFCCSTPRWFYCAWGERKNGQ